MICYGLHWTQISKPINLDNNWQMIGKILAIYISLRFLKTLFAMVLGLTFLIITVDFIEQLRKAANAKDVSIFYIYLISMLRAPVFVEKAFPFAALFAAMITLIQLNLKMELVVARSSGVSASQFLLPISISAAIVGILVGTVHNPYAISAFEYSETLTAEVIYKRPKNNDTTTRNYWIKQKNDNNGSTIINAELARKNGKLLDNVTFLQFDSEWRVIERLDAKQALHTNNTWLVNEIVRTDLSGKQSNSSSETMPTNLTDTDLFSIIAKPDNISFWKLKDTASRLEKSGTNGKPYLVHYYSLIALPFMLISMVFVAATVCLRFTRSGELGKMIVTGIMSGFFLYIFTNLISSLGNAGIVPPPAAAFAPSFIAIALSSTILLILEDG